jgi:plastocyanin
MRMTRTLAFLAGALSLVACGGGGGGDDGGGTTNPPPQVLGSIELAPPAATVRVGESVRLTPTAKTTQGTVISGATGYTFTSSDQARATVSATGDVTGVAVGGATITASLTRDGVTRSATSTITVNNDPFPTAVTVQAGDNNQFSPRTVTIARGGTVTWAFASTIHNVVFGSTAGAPQNIGNSSNASVARTFNTAGTFDYDCSLHAGMTGTVSVR